MLRVDIGGPPASLDPALQRDPSEHAAANAYSEPLLRPRADLNDTRPAAASGFDVSADGLTYTFHLRPDGRFNDGSAVTAADFVFAWRRLIDPRTGSPQADFFASAVQGGFEAEALDPCCAGNRIDAAVAALGLEAPDPLTFVVRLPRPEVWFKWIAALWTGVPLKAAAVARGSLWATTPGGLVTNGSFMVTGVAPDHLTLEPNPYHAGPAPRLRQVLMYGLANPQAAYDLFRVGNLDEAPVPPAELATVSGDPALAAQLKRAPQLAVSWITFNAARPPFDNALVRLAFAEAVDPAAYARRPGEAETLAATGLIPTGMPLARPAVEPLVKFDPAAGRRHLAESGVPPDQLAGIRLLVRDSPTGRDLDQFLHQQLLSNLGISITTDSVSSTVLADRIAARDFQITGPKGWTGDYPDPQNWFDVFTTTSGQNLGRWSDPVYDQLVGLGDSTAFGPDRRRLYEQAALRLAAGVPAIFLSQPETVVIVQPRVRAVAGNPGDPAPLLGAGALASVYIGAS